ncbi:MAG: hypothetical protein AAF488_05260 [Planctomycetota bacterium]
MKFLLAVTLLGVTAFCGFGFLATFEPLDRSMQIAWRVAYGSGFLGALVGMAALARRKTDS